MKRIPEIATALLIALMLVVAVYPVGEQHQQQKTNVRLGDALGHRWLTYEMGGAIHVIRTPVNAIFFDGGKSTLYFPGGTLRNFVSPGRFLKALEVYEAYVEKHGHGPPLSFED